MASVSDNAAKLAVLIDADNAQPSIIEGLLAEVAKYGTAHVKRAYGDWTGTNLKGWKDQLLAQSIQPIQQFAYTTGKNATDAAMVIDAMDLLYSGRLDGFCIVSSDSDFTRLAARHPGVRADRVRVRRAQDAQAVRRRLRQVHLHREPDLEHEWRTTPAPAPRRPAEPAPGHPAKRGHAHWSTSCATPSRRPPTTTVGRRWPTVGHHHHQAAPRLRLPQLRLQEAERPDHRDQLFELERRSPGEGKQAVIFARDKRRRDKKP